MSDDSSLRPSGRKAGRPAKPKKPRPDFPLSIHRGTGYWCRKVRGRVYYFGKVADDPKGVAAEEEWNQVKDDLYAGREPRAKAGDLTVADLCSHYLDHKEELRDRGEISPRTFYGLHATCTGIVEVFGKGRAVTDLGPDDFGKLRAKLAERRAAVALRNEMQRVRSVFRHGLVNGLIDGQVRYGSKFGKPELKQVRRERREKRDAYGKRMFEATEIRALLGAAGQPLRTMILLGINCGLGQTDLARLPTDYVDLDNAMIDYPRPKTEADRVCPLWDETVEAIREWLPMRRRAKKPADGKLLFLTVRGAPWVKVSDRGAPKDAIGQEFDRLLRRLGIKRRGLSFYGLRHSFRTVADETRDPVAINLIMGHVDNSMGAHYREDVSDDRLRRVAEHVRAWLFADVAYHEAGHAVISYRLDFYLGSATIVPDHHQGTEGSQSGESTWPDGSRDADYIVSLYAGGAAQRRFNPAAEGKGCGQDDEKAGELLQSHPDLNEERLRKRSHELVAKHWPEIEAVARALLDERTLSGDDIEFVCLAVEEGGDWRSKLAAYREHRGLFAG